MEPPGWQDKGLVADYSCLCWENRAEPSPEVSSCIITGAPAGSEGLADTLLQHPKGKSQTTLDCATQLLLWSGLAAARPGHLQPV